MTQKYDPSQPPGPTLERLLSAGTDPVEICRLMAAHSQECDAGQGVDMALQELPQPVKRRTPPVGAPGFVPPQQQVDPATTAQSERERRRGVKDQPQPPPPEEKKEASQTDDLNKAEVEKAKNKKKVSDSAEKGFQS